MMDKKVVMCDFNGIKEGMLVRIDKNWRDDSEEIALVLDRVTYAHMLGEGAAESYDPMLVVLSSGTRKTVPVDAVTIVDEDD